MSRLRRCAACGKRIRRRHPYIGVEDYSTRVEFTYHARPRCQQRAAEETAIRMERGKVYFLHHYHVCDDVAAGFNCAGGCFALSTAAEAN
jgi:hypothetical protein